MPACTRGEADVAVRLEHPRLGRCSRTSSARPPLSTTISSLDRAVLRPRAPPRRPDRRQAFHQRLALTVGDDDDRDQRRGAHSDGSRSTPSAQCVRARHGSRRAHALAGTSPRAFARAGIGRRSSSDQRRGDARPGIPGRNRGEPRAAGLDPVAPDPITASAIAARPRAERGAEPLALDLLGEVIAARADDRHPRPDRVQQPRAESEPRLEVIGLGREHAARPSSQSARCSYGTHSSLKNTWVSSRPSRRRAHAPRPAARAAGSVEAPMKTSFARGRRSPAARPRGSPACVQPRPDAAVPEDQLVLRADLREAPHGPLPLGRRLGGDPEGHAVDPPRSEGSRSYSSGASARPPSIAPSHRSRCFSEAHIRWSASASARARGRSSAWRRAGAARPPRAGARRPRRARGRRRRRRAARERAATWRARPGRLGDDRVGPCDQLAQAAAARAAERLYATTGTPRAAGGRDPRDRHLGVAVAPRQLERPDRDAGRAPRPARRI